MSFIILGGGLAGISCSYHLGHEHCEVFEKNDYLGGHVYSEKRNGFIWDEGPHVSFTKYEYVKTLFAKSVQNEFLEYEVQPTNYYKGCWIPHPAQSNLYAIPEPLRSECLNDFIATRDQTNGGPENYQQWLDMAFGKAFSENFPSVYTKKYWTVNPNELSTEWVGERVFYPDVETVKAGYYSPLEKSTHYISNVRYPLNGGYYSFAQLLSKSINVQYKKEVEQIDLDNKEVSFKDGTKKSFERLISTIPLPLFVEYCNAPSHVKEAAQQLVCSQLLLINIEVDHASLRNEHWMYVYDENKLSTRINFVDLLSPNNTPQGKSGIQVEVYFSKYQPINCSYDDIAERVINELIEMGLIKSKGSINNIHTKWIEFANVIFDHNYKTSLDTVLDWLNSKGLNREADDLEPMTDWGKASSDLTIFGNVILAGRYGQWKYYWSDDCVLRGKQIKDNLING
jgi:protoporphyrinogen oxidase